VQAGGVKDMADNACTAVASSAALQVSVYAGDTIAPTLTQFVLFDLVANSMTLSFSEPVTVSTADFTAITFADFGSGPASQYTLTSATSASTDGSTSVSISLSVADVNAIKLSPNLCTLRTNCWVRLTDLLVTDAAGNKVTPVSDPSLLPAYIPTTFTADSVEPTLTAWTINMDTGVMTFTFDEPVNYIKFRPTSAIIIQDSQANPTLTYTVTTGTPAGVQPNALAFTFQLSAADILALKAIDGLAKSQANTYISITDALITDMNSNKNLPLPDAGNGLVSLQASAYTADTTPPTLSAFSSFDQGSGVLTLVFDEPVKLSSVDPTKLTLFAQSNAGNSRAVSGGTVAFGGTNPSNKMTVLVTLSGADIQFVSTNTQGIFKAKASTYIAIGAAGVSDSAAIAIQAPHAFKSPRSLPALEHPRL
jgi:hypothetical protein